MIEVEAHYYNRQSKQHKGNDYFIYTYFCVKGHANNGSKDDCIKVCAGVSACVIGIKRLFDATQYDVKYDKGLFEVKLLHDVVEDSTYVDKDTIYALNTLLCQLYDLYLMYPSQFKRFDMIEKKGIEEYYVIKEPKAKPFRQLKRERKL